MEQEDKFEQTPGASQGNIHPGLNKGKNEEGHAGSLKGKEPDSAAKEEEQKEAEDNEEDTIGIP